MKTNRKKFETPTLDIIGFESADVIATSGGSGGSGKDDEKYNIENAGTPFTGFFEIK